MKIRLPALAALAAFLAVSSAAFLAVSATGASAQAVIDLSGRFRCVQGCAGGSPGPAYVTQNGWTMNLTNEVGQPTRAWIDRPGHIWAENWREGATYSPDGMTIQFDQGTVWERDLTPVLPPPPPPPPPRRKHR